MQRLGESIHLEKNGTVVIGETRSPLARRISSGHRSETPHNVSAPSNEITVPNIRQQREKRKLLPASSSSCHTSSPILKIWTSNNELLRPICMKGGVSYACVNFNEVNFIFLENMKKNLRFNLTVCKILEWNALDYSLQKRKICSSIVVNKCRGVNPIYTQIGNCQLRNLFF
jgi:hypothetical protein